ncbi:MAG TPA: gliding motility-associated C-terminal domain-containing protein, partial [Ferruginibacter sp.]|nr:gliding motility-associated C-terminal domain-containing protein [Ferruginibacter sp.]
LAIVRMYAVPTVDAGADKILSYNATFTFDPVYSADVNSYAWTPSVDLSCDNCANPVGTALQKRTYRIDVANNDGCVNSDSVTVFVNCLQANLLMPTAFTPNNDGLNDYFYPITRGYRMVKTFIIYNRLGFKVFERSNFFPNIPNLGWNGQVKGTANGKTEVFTWYMEAECDLGRMNNTMGTVVLIR